METDGRNKQRIFHKILTYGAALILCSVVALIVLQLIGSSTGRDVSNENIVLTFIGILATFIVVGNFSQVREVEERIRREFEDFRRNTNEAVNSRLLDQKSFYDENLKTQINNLKENEIAQLMQEVQKCNDATLDIPSKISSKSIEIKDDITKKLKTILDYFVETYETKKISSFIQSVNRGEIHSYKVHLASEDPKKTYVAIARINETNNKIEFYKVDSTGKIAELPIPKSVNKLDDVAFNTERVNGILNLYKRYLVNDKDYSGYVQDTNEHPVVDSPSTYNN